MHHRIYGGRASRVLLSILLLTLGLAGGSFVGSAPQRPHPKFVPPQAGQPILPDQFIVQLQRDVVPADIHAFRQQAERMGLEVVLQSDGPVPFITVRGPEAVVFRLADDPRVRLVEHDGPVYAVEQTLPWGIDRIDADVSPTANINGVDERVGVDAFIIDTGIQPDHPDLYVVGGRNFTSKNPDAWKDCNGHGTHVAGTVAALDNTYGVVGVAPGARLWAVRVLGCGGSGTWSAVAAGVNWVTQWKQSHPTSPAVANMSLGGSGHNATVHDAVVTSIQNNVVYCIAAGNDGADASNFEPAHVTEALTITATDSTDTMPSWANWGFVVDLAAPGVSILSTYLRSGYTTLSGTSMATPHCTGTATLYLATHPTATASDAMNDIVTKAQTFGGFTANTDPQGRRYAIVYAGRY
ncbi:Extracellular serine proteinase [bacterium HR11]|nr:Extracellular serine proteinase [bacterium HR11]